MHDLIYKHVAPHDDEAQQLIEEINAALYRITGDDGRSSFVEEAFNPAQDVFVVAVLNGEPVGCGAFRAHDARTCEIKRMYSKFHGVGTALLRHLEETAVAFGYTHTILSTRRVNTQAVWFYQRHGYQESAPYGKYQASPASVCFGKALRRAPSSNIPD